MNEPQGKKVLFFLAATGVIAAGVMALVEWASRHRARTFDLAPIASAPSVGAVPPRPEPARQAAVSDWAFGRVVSTSDVSTTPKRIVPAWRGGPRRITISADQPIRVLNDATVSAAQGVYIAAGQPYTWPAPIGGEVELWAVRAGDNDAQVSATVQKWEGA